MRLRLVGQPWSPHRRFNFIDVRQVRDCESPIVERPVLYTPVSGSSVRRAPSLAEAAPSARVLDEVIEDVAPISHNRHGIGGEIAFSPAVNVLRTPARLQLPTCISEPVTAGARYNRRHWISFLLT